MITKGTLKMSLATGLIIVCAIVGFGGVGMACFLIWIRWRGTEEREAIGARPKKYRARRVRIKDIERMEK